MVDKIILIDQLKETINKIRTTNNASDLEELYKNSIQLISKLVIERANELQNK